MSNDTTDVLAAADLSADAFAADADATEATAATVAAHVDAKEYAAAANIHTAAATAAAVKYAPDATFAKVVAARVPAFDAHTAAAKAYKDLAASLTK